MNIFDQFENLPKIVFTRPSEGDYYGFHFENILCECDYPTYYPKSTLNNNKVRKNINIVLVTIFDKFQNLPKDLICLPATEIVAGKQINCPLYLRIHGYLLHEPLLK